MKENQARPSRTTADFMEGARMVNDTEIALWEERLN